MSPRPLPFSAIRWWRPNRCCSSTTAKREVVRTTRLPARARGCRSRRSTAPSATPARTRARSLPVTAPVSSAYVSVGLRRRRHRRLRRTATPVRRPAADASRTGTAPPHRLEQRSDRACVLARQHLGRRHDRGLVTGPDRDQTRVQRHERLAGADVALQQQVHRRGTRHRRADLVHRPPLRLRRLERHGRRAAPGRAARPLRARCPLPRRRPDACGTPRRARA